MQGEDADDLTALRRVAEGDKGAFGPLVHRHKQAVYRFARTLCDSEATAEDVLQETFVAALRHAGTFRGEGSVRGWLLRIARNQVATAYRRRSGEPPVHESLDALGSEAGWGAETPWDQLLDRDALTRAMSTLSEEDREILVLRELEGLTGQQTAEVLELTLPGMKSRLHRARLRLAAALRKGGFDGA